MTGTSVILHSVVLLTGEVDRGGGAGDEQFIPDRVRLALFAVVTVIVRVVRDDLDVHALDGAVKLDGAELDFLLAVGVELLGGAGEHHLGTADVPLVPVLTDEDAVLHPFQCQRVADIGTAFLDHLHAGGRDVEGNIGSLDDQELAHGQILGDVLGQNLGRRHGGAVQGPLGVSVREIRQ